MKALSMQEDISSVITRLGAGMRSSLAVTQRGTAYFAVTPHQPYDGSLSAAEQAHQLLAKAQDRLHQLGSRKDLLIFTAIILSDMTHYGAVNTVWDAWVAPGAPPARACFAATLASPDLKVEMIMIAAVDTPDPA